MQFVALAQLCDVFMGKCAALIKESAESAEWLLTHDEPEFAASEPQDEALFPVKDFCTGSRVEAFYDEQWYTGTIFEVASEDGLWKVQCDVDPLGTLTPTKKIRGTEPAGLHLEAAEVDVAKRATGAVHVVQQTTEISVGVVESAVRSVGELSRVGGLLGIAQFPISSENILTVTRGVGGGVVPVPNWFIDLNEIFWCCVSLVIHIVTAYMLFVCLILRVATFAGEIVDITLITASLYMVFDLDGKVMESNPELGPRYRREVLRQTERNTRRCSFIAALAGMSFVFLKVLKWVGLLTIVFAAWRHEGNGCVIGGNPADQGNSICNKK